MHRAYSLLHLFLFDERPSQRVLRRPAVSALGIFCQERLVCSRGLGKGLLVVIVFANEEKRFFLVLGLEIALDKLGKSGGGPP